MTCRLQNSAFIDAAAMLPQNTSGNHTVLWHWGLIVNFDFDAAVFGAAFG